MRAAVFNGPDAGVAIANRRTPAGAREILLRVDWCGMCKTDISMTSDRSGTRAPGDTVLGHEFAGEVVALGDPQTWTSHAPSGT